MDLGTRTPDVTHQHRSLPLTACSAAAAAAAAADAASGVTKGTKWVVVSLRSWVQQARGRKTASSKIVYDQ